jgi:hypothetical protein
MFNLKAIRSLGLPVRFLSGPKADHIDINDIETIPNLPFLPFSLSLPPLYPARSITTVAPFVAVENLRRGFLVCVASL